jgi:hypothetical protein
MHFSILIDLHFIYIHLLTMLLVTSEPIMSQIRSVTEELIRNGVEGVGSFEVFPLEFTRLPAAQVFSCRQQTATVTSVQQRNSITFCPLLQIARYGTIYKWPPSVQEGDTPNHK